MRTLITGYAGFIGSNLTRKIAMYAHPDDEIIGLDCFTYAARPEWAWNGLSDRTFYEEKVDLRNADEVSRVIKDFMPERIFHLAAESHVCRSIDGPRAFAETNFMGTFNLLEALRVNGWKGKMVHISTDEAFGDLDMYEPPFTEETPVKPNSPYAASKCASDMMVRAYAMTYGINAVITRCTNNYGPNQHEEKLIPKAILSMLAGTPMTMYGDGSHCRDWIHVDDHCEALLTAAHEGRAGEVYCVGSGLELSNKEVVHCVAGAMHEELGWKGMVDMVFTDDRPTDDRRYAVRTNKIAGIGWLRDPSPKRFHENLKRTVRWYADEVSNG
jgi:dTDP-glucose 4,6-dehydratase